MPISRRKKEELVQEVAEKIKDSRSIVYADYRGLSVEEMNQVRSELRKEGIELKVIKRNLFRIAAQEAGAKIDESTIKNHPIAYAFGKDEVVPAKTIFNFAKKFENLEMVGGAVNGKSITMNELRALATMPSREEMYAKIVGSLASPLRGIVTVLNGTQRNLVSVLGQIADQKK